MDLPSQMLTQPMEELFKVPSFAWRGDAGVWALGEWSCSASSSSAQAQGQHHVPRQGSCTALVRAAGAMSFEKLFSALYYLVIIFSTEA